MEGNFVLGQQKHLQLLEFLGRKYLKRKTGIFKTEISTKMYFYDNQTTISEEKTFFIST